MEATSVSTDGLMDKKDIYIFSGILLCCCCLLTKLSLRVQAAAMAHRARPRGATPRPRSGAEAGRTPCPRGGGQEELPASKVRGGGRECQAATVQERPRGATLRPRSGVAAKRSYPTSEARGGSQDELPHSQGAVAARAQEGLEERLHVQGQEGRR